MQSWTALLSSSRALLNDQDTAVYTDTVLLPYLNLALSELEELFELNNMPVTNQTSAILTAPAGTTSIGYDGSPRLPFDLVDIQQVYESITGQNAWSPVAKKEFLTRSLLGTTTPIAQFGVWAWIDQKIALLASLQSNDLKLDYIKSLFPELTANRLIEVNTILNVDTFIQFRVAALAAEFIDENFARAGSLNTYAGSGIQRSLGIGVKGMQSIPVRRRPFRAAYKRRRMTT